MATPAALSARTACTGVRGASVADGTTGGGPNAQRRPGSGMGGEATCRLAVESMSAAEGAGGGNGVGGKPYLFALLFYSTAWQQTQTPDHSCPMPST